jgi:hypothetical protein
VTAGVSVAKATSILNVLRNTAYAAVATPFVQLHVGDPGAAGTANVAAVTTRNAVTWNAPSGTGPVSMTLASLAAFTGISAETITHISIWTASTAGTFIESWALSAGVPIIGGSSLTISPLTLTASPIAA